MANPQSITFVVPAMSSVVVAAATEAQVPSTQVPSTQVPRTQVPSMQVPSMQVPSIVVASRGGGKESKVMNVPERVCGCLCCFPCITWSVVMRFLCLPCDCIAGHPCGGNACTKLCDAACLMPIVFGDRFPVT